jgi:hypothetical protein
MRWGPVELCWAVDKLQRVTEWREGEGALGYEIGAGLLVLWAALELLELSTRLVGSLVLTRKRGGCGP